MPNDWTDQQALLDLNTDFRMKGMASTEITALGLAAWKAGAISHDSLFELFRRSENLPDGRNNEEEAGLIGKGLPRERLKAEGEKSQGNEGQRNGTRMRNWG